MTIPGILRYALLSVPLLLIGSCAQDGSFSPSRPVGGPVLSDTCEFAYGAYLRESQPVFFAADPTGNYCGYAICTHRRCVNGFPGDAVRACERISGGADCYVYAQGFTQSWRGPDPVVDAPPPQVQLSPGSVPVERLRRRGFSISDDRD